MRKFFPLLVVAAVLMGCATTPSNPVRPPNPVALNPVTLAHKLERLGCKVPAGASVGTQDINGNYFTECSWPEGGSIDVRAGTDLSDVAPDDSHKVIVGKGWQAVYTGSYTIDSGGGENTITYEVPAESIAAILGGTVVSPGE